MTIFLSSCRYDNTSPCCRNDNIFPPTAFGSFFSGCLLVRVVCLKEKKDLYHVLDENCMVTYEQLFEAFFSLQCRAEEGL